MKQRNQTNKSDSENEIIEFLRVIVIERLKEIPLTKLYSFFIEKIIYSWANPITLKNIKIGNLLVEVCKKTRRKFNQNENLLEFEMQNLLVWKT